MVELIIPVVGALSTGIPAYFLYRAKRDRMKRDEKIIERADPKDMPAIARALNPPHELGPWRRRQVPPAAEGPQDPDQGT